MAKNKYDNQIKKSLAKVGLDDYVRSVYESHQNPAINSGFLINLALLAHYGFDLFVITPDHTSTSSGNYMLDTLLKLHLVQIVKYMTDDSGIFARCELTDLGSTFINKDTDLPQVSNLAYRQYHHGVVENEHDLYRAARNNLMASLAVFSIIILICCATLVTASILLGLSRFLWMPIIVISIILWIFYFHSFLRKLRHMIQSTKAYTNDKNVDIGKQYSWLCNFASSAIFDSLVLSDSESIKLKDMLRFILQHPKSYQDLYKSQLTLKPLSMLLSDFCFRS